MDTAMDAMRRKTRRISEVFRKSPLPQRPRNPGAPEDQAIPITLLLDGTELVYENGLWVRGNSDSDVMTEQLASLAERNEKLQEENQILKFKLEIMTDMLATAKLDVVRLQESIKGGS